jgi:hypothetical protein
VKRLGLVILAVVALPATVLAAANPHAEQLHPTAAGKKLAKRALLRSSDLGPDWTRIALPQGDSSLTCPNFDPDLSAFTIHGRASTSFVQSGMDQISSSAVVYASRAQAVGDFKAAARPELAGCLRYLITREFRKAGIAAGVPSARMLEAPGLGERSASYRVVWRIRSGRVSVTAYSDFLVVQRGRTIAALGFTGVDGPIPSRNLYARLVAARMG